MTLSSIDKRSNLSNEEFYNEYVLPGKPVVICDATRKWKAMGKFTPEYFKKNYPDVKKEINGRVIRMSDYIDHMLFSTPENPAPYPYNFNVEKVFPELLSFLQPQLAYGKLDRVNHPLVPKSFFKGTEVHEFFFGGYGSSFPFLHVDALFLHTQITQLYGNKEFFLFSPEQSPYMYPREDKPLISSVKNVFEPDYEKYPLFKNTRALRVMVNEGESVYFPTGWWHVTRIYGPSISYGRVHLNELNWQAFIAENYKLWKRYHPVTSEFMKLYAGVAHTIIKMQERMAS